MNNINAFSLFHFTKSLNILESIIKSGLRYSFSVEERPETLDSLKEYNNTGGKMIIPMICFCDIPLMRTLNHRKTYGNYCIGFDKSLLISKLKETLNPVAYYNSLRTIHSLCSLYEFSEKKINDGIEEFRMDPLRAIDPNNIFLQGHKIQSDLKYILAYFKPCYKLSKDNVKKDYTEEREWRAVLDDNILKWNLNASGRTYYDQEENKERFIAEDVVRISNEMINEKPLYYLQFTEDEIRNGITHILTNEEREIPEVVDLILTNESLFGYKGLSDNFRKILVSKIISFERIEKDF